MYVCSRDSEVKQNCYRATLQRKLNDVISQTASLSKTALLWTEYIKQVSLVRLVIRAERCGSWDLHVDTVKRMLPYFHAAGHLQYAKSAHLYVQQMCDLQQVMNPDEYEQYTQQGYFTVRRTDRFWSGLWTDMTI